MFGWSCYIKYDVCFTQDNHAIRIISLPDGRLVESCVNFVFIFHRWNNTNLCLVVRLFGLVYRVFPFAYCFRFCCKLSPSPTFIPTGKVTTLAGGSQGLVDGIGREARFYHPTGNSLDVYSGILYVADHVRALSTFLFYYFLTLFV